MQVSSIQGYPQAKCSQKQISKQAFRSNYEDVMNASSLVLFHEARLRWVQDYLANSDASMKSIYGVLVERALADRAVAIQKARELGIFVWKD